MAPNILGSSTLVLSATSVDSDNYRDNKTSENVVATVHSSPIKSTDQHRQSYFQFEFKDIVWKNVIIFLYLHGAAIYGIYLLAIREAKFMTFVLGYMYGTIGAFGITAGAHRLWAHKSYKATWQLRLILAVANLIAFQNCIHEWVRDHRVHHKYTDTNADPHNSKRGFFFSHMGWLVLRKHPDVKEKGANISMADLEQDAIVMFQKKHYALLMPTFAFIIPTLIPYLFVGEQFWYSLYIAGALRYMMTLHFTWLVNSAAHIWGMRPYDQTIRPSNNVTVAFLALGEGWHNYHHVFPWDYKTSELGDYSLNLTTAVIDFFAKIGWAYDLKTVPEDLIRKRAARTGDGSTKYSKCIGTADPKTYPPMDENNNEEIDDKLKYSQKPHNNVLGEENLIWGWDDTDMNAQDKCGALIINKIKNKTALD